MELKYNLNYQDSLNRSHEYILVYIIHMTSATYEIIRR
jgi:hypothetical protein